MNIKANKVAQAVVCLALPISVACGGVSDDVGSTEQAVLGDALPGTDPADFAVTKATFSATETREDGLGPIFNEGGCGICHATSAIGGAGEQIEQRFGRIVNGTFDGFPNNGGSLRQLRTIGTFTVFANNVNRQCTVPFEQEPAGVTRRAGRLTTPLFGLGLVDAMPDSFFDGLAAAQPAAIRGTVNRVTTLFPNPDDPSQRVGSIRVGRFGWKAGIPNLFQFSADAYVNEMGITTVSCFAGVANTTFAFEQIPGAAQSSNPSQPSFGTGCTDDVLPGIDDPVELPCAGRTEVQDDVAEFAEFMTRLAPPPVGARGAAENAGATVFAAVGCAGCHVSTTFRTPAAPGNGVPGNFAFNPFSDFLLHDMGALGDGIGDQGQADAQTRRMRTAPLWGIRFRNKLLHDGRTTSIDSAIRAHAGQAAAAAAAFAARSQVDRNNLIAFVRSL